MSPLPNSQLLEHLEATPPLPSAEHPNITRRRDQLELLLRGAAFEAFHFELRMHALKRGCRELEQLQ